VAQPETIAVIDDTEGTRYALRRTLEMAGYKVLEGGTGADAIRLAAGTPDLIILDMHLPDAMGDEIARRLKSDPATKSIPLLHHSASYTDSSAQAAGLESGADAYLAEPVEPALLLATIRALLRSHAAEKAMERALQTRDEALAIASHDVRGMLQALKLSMETQLRRAQGRDFDQEALLKSLQRSSMNLQTMSRTIEDLLDRSQLEAGHLRLSLAEVDLSSVVKNALERWADGAAAVGSEMSFAAQEPIRGKFDEVRVGQMVSNLVSNALKYGGGKPIEIRVRKAEREAEIEVVDKGTGIDPSEHDRIFDRYERASGPRTGSYGLGLWIARELARLHGGTVTVQSGVNEGAKFCIRLPLQ
jgi:signal transduction histidine kinase